MPSTRRALLDWLELYKTTATRHAVEHHCANNIHTTKDDHHQQPVVAYVEPDALCTVIGIPTSALAQPHHHRTVVVTGISASSGSALDALPSTTCLED